MPRFRPLAALVAAMLAVGAAPAVAATGGGWTLVEHRRVPIEYYQGLTHVGPRTFFVGIFRGGYLTDASLLRLKGKSNLIPAPVAQAVGFNHVGDPTYDSAGSRLLAPLECYRPLMRNPNSCGFGGLGVIDPVTLEWRYWVRFDGADVPKAMWAEVSPDGKLVWTSAGRDLVAYRMADVAVVNAAHDRSSAPIRPARRLRGAVPPSGANGAAFFGPKLLLAGSSSGVPQIWAVDLATGKRRLQLQLKGVRAEVEGIAVAASRGGQLQWLLAPGLVSRPTYGRGHCELLTFVPVNHRVSASARLRGSKLTVHAKLRSGRSDHALRGATVRVGNRVGRTDDAGVVRFELSSVPRRPLRVTVAKGELRPLTMAVRPLPSTG